MKKDINIKRMILFSLVTTGLMLLSACGGSTTGDTTTAENNGQGNSNNTLIENEIEESAENNNSSSVEGEAVVVAPEPTLVLEPVIRGSQAISSENIMDVEYLDGLGKGTFVEAFWLDDSRYVVVSLAGLDTYSSEGELINHIPIIDANYELSRNGQYVAMRTGESTNVALWALATGEQIHEFVHEQAMPPLNPRSSVHQWIWAQTFSLKFDHASERLAVGYGDFSIGIWSIEGGEEDLLFDGPLITPFKMAFSSDGNYLVYQDELGASAAIYVWDILNHSRFISVAGVGTFGDNPFSLDSKNLVIYYNSGFSVYELRWGGQLFKGGTGQLAAVVEYSDDGEYLVAPEYGMVMDIDDGSRLSDVSYVAPEYRRSIEVLPVEAAEYEYYNFQGIYEVSVDGVLGDGTWGKSENGFYMYELIETY